MQIHSTTLGLKNKTNNGIKLFFFLGKKTETHILYSDSFDSVRVKK